MLPAQPLEQQAQQPLASAGKLGQCDGVWGSWRGRDALTQIFRRLPVDARARAASVCHVWHDAAADPPVRAVMHFDGCRVAVDDALLAALCGRAGKALTELHLNVSGCKAVTAAGVVTALRVGGCFKLRCLVLHRFEKWWRHGPQTLTLQNAKQLAAALPKLQETSCVVNCETHDQVADARAALPGSVMVLVRGVPAERSVLPAKPAEGQGLAAGTVRTFVEATLRDLLGDDVNVTGDMIMLDAGLDSVMSTELVSMLQYQLGVELSSTLIFDYPTIDALVEHLAELLKVPGE
jgi:acyl carrier protein